MRRQILGAAGVLIGTAVAVPLIVLGQLRWCRHIEERLQASQDAMMHEWRLPEPGADHTFYD